MKIDFYIRFHTKMGEALFITGNLGVLGSNEAEHALAMSFLSNEYWKASVEIDELYSDPIHYRYIFKNENGDLLVDGEKHRFITPNGKDIVVIDSWNNSSEVANVFYTAPFRDVFFKYHKQLKFKAPGFYTHVFKIKAPLLKDNESVCLLGSTTELKNWQKEEPLQLQSQ